MNGNCGSYLSLCNTRKELIRKAIENGEIFNDGPDGTESRKATPQEVASFVLNLYDDAIYHLIENMALGEAEGRFMMDHGFPPQKYMKQIVALIEEEETKRIALYSFGEKE